METSKGARPQKDGKCVYNEGQELDMEPNQVRERIIPYLTC